MNLRLTTPALSGLAKLQKEISPPMARIYTVWQPSTTCMPVNAETYEVPTLALLTAIVAVFATLCVQGRSYPSRKSRPDLAPTVEQRHLLWLAGWTLLVVRLAINISAPDQTRWILGIAHACAELAALMFLGSLAPQYLSEKPRVLYVVAFGVPLLVYSTVLSLDPRPGPLAHVTLVVCALAGIYVAARWSLIRHLLPEWLSLLFIAAVGTACLWLTLEQDYAMVLVLVHSGILLMTALLFAAEFRRVTAGVLFTVGGLTLWALPAIAQTVVSPQPLSAGWLRALNLLKVLTAVGMIVLVLEDEIAANLAAQERDHRARIELEKYTAISLSNITTAEEKDEYNRICATIAGASRFRQAGVFLAGPEHNFRLAGQAGMDGALAGALDALARRTTAEQTEVIAAGNHFTPQAGSLTLMDLSPLMQPGDELRQMSFRKAYVMGIRSRDGRLLGALMLAGLRNPEEPLQTEDVLPLELLAARMGSEREQQVLLRRLMQSEKLAGLGQLAGGVAHELNNPLTAVSGYAELLADNQDPRTRDHAQVIINEARRMKQIIESLLRFRKATPGERTLVPLRLMLVDIEKLVRRELDAKHIQLMLQLPENLPRVRVDGDQIRQVFLQLTRNAITSLEESPPDWERRLTVEAVRFGKAVQITFRDSGPGFADPGRAFDPYFSIRHPGEGMGLGLSICYSIVREHGGELSAVNLHPHGAAVVIEFPIEEADAEAPTAGDSAKLFPDAGRLNRVQDDSSIVQ